MPGRDESPNDIRGMIRRVGERARAERAADAMARMERDDLLDESDSQLADSREASSRGSDSSAWFDSSDAFGQGAEDNRPTLDAPSSLADSGLTDSGDETDEPSLADPSPTGHGGGSRSTLVSTPVFRPTRRPPMAVLRVYDDNQRDAETVRVRQTPFVIGRQDGDLVIGHERQMSRRHARIDRVQEGEAWRWYLGDLRSTNGTFLRTDRVTLEDGAEVLVGGELVRFLESPSGGPPSLLKVAPSAEEQRVALTSTTHLIGTDSAKCLPFLEKSPFLDPCHYRVELSAGRWVIIDLASANHLWVAITKRSELAPGAMFQIGEQRFSFHLP